MFIAVSCDTRNLKMYGISTWPIPWSLRHSRHVAGVRSVSVAFVATFFVMLLIGPTVFGRC